MSTGDLKGSLRKLELQLRALKYPKEVDYPGDRPLAPSLNILISINTSFGPRSLSFELCGPEEPDTHSMHTEAFGLGSFNFTTFQLQRGFVKRDLELARGDPSSFLPVLSYAFVSYSPHFAEHLVASGVELAGKSDLRFIETVYKVLRDLFHYKPLLTKQQFLQFGFAERKIELFCDIIGFVTKKHKELSKRSKPDVQKRSQSCFPPADPPCKTEAFLPETDALRAAALPKQPLVVRNFGCATSAFSTPLLHNEDSKVEEEELPKEEESRDVATPSVPPPVDAERLKALEVQLQQFQVELDKFSILERRLEALERDMCGKIIIDRQEWDNLESRVLLLETRLMMSEVQKDSCTAIEDGSSARHDHCELRYKTFEFSLQCCDPPIAEDTHLAALTDVPKVDIKERLERIANMMKDTSCLLKRVEPSV